MTPERGPTLRLAYLYPDLMNLYADRGNVTCLQRALRLARYRAARDDGGLGRFA